MWIKVIKTSNFGGFSGDKEFLLLDKINFIKGKNGTGKTTLSLLAPLFAIYGYSPKNLEQVPTRGTNKCAVEIQLDHNGKEYIITREYPSKLTVLEDGIPLTQTTTKEKDKYLESIFGSLDYFKKFRTIDKDEGINIVEEGKTQLRKTLFSIHENFFNSIRLKLQENKRKKEIYNKDALVYKHFPSPKRLKILADSLLDLYEKEHDIENQINQAKKDLENTSRIIGNVEGTKSYIVNRKYKTSELQNICPTCSQTISSDIKKSLIEDLVKELDKLEIELARMDVLFNDQKDVYDILNNLRSKHLDKIQKLDVLRVKLNTSLKQAEYKYTEKDVLIVKQAIEELDKFSSSYLTDYIKNLEPIINSILNKIGFSINFELDAKGNFDFVLYKDETKYYRDDLSTGQKLILQIAFKLAILLERGEGGIIIADEGMSSLDRDNLLYIIDIFSNFNFQLIFVIHNVEDLPPYVKPINLDE